MKETTEAQLLALGPAPDSPRTRQAIFVYTPLCGTCKMGARMLEVAAAMGAPLPLARLNVNYAPLLRERWRIASVPALVLLDGEDAVHIEYAMRSVQHLQRLLAAHAAADVRRTSDTE
ncbi:thioredoxin family protein [Paenibacillus sp. IB182496]|uniref:Thioredoxin family protein n=1 Tax=Paenibacillus sabuli TaxID=2772509 RepID=A0A927BUT1_9BACL|nr:thioredoxin family protein [Paenibacillus sabuli]MBD2846727.1 thioredoxin family protein [Paenibacillus sabuli]